MVPILLVVLSFGLTTPLAAEQQFAAAREHMVSALQAIAKTAQSREIDPAVLAAMREVPRHELVPEAVRHSAYANHPLPIGYDQSISQPYIVALMTTLAMPAKHHVVLEVGTGSGYQAAVLSRLVARVYSMEIIEALAKEAAEKLRLLGFDNVHVRVGDGYKGWPESAPFDAILVTAAANHVPLPLVEQLKPGGRMVIPVGSTSMSQNLIVVEKEVDGTTHRRSVLPVRFVPLTGRARQWLRPVKLPSERAG